MKKLTRVLVVALAAALVFPLGVQAAFAAAWSSSDRWGTWSNGGYTLRNDVWGNGHGPQTISADSYSKWNVWANHPNTGGVKSYPHAAKAVNKRLSSIGWLNSSFNVSVPGSGAYATTYDIWADNNAYEVMLWMNENGAVGPIASSYDANGAVPNVRNATVGGHTWNVYRGSNGSNAVFSFVRTSKTNSATVDVLAIMNWLRGQGWWGDVTLGDVQFGFEITGTAGQSGFVCDSFSVDYS
jgi:acyl CoA:acetate/3-ketoacid CoA transferase